MTIWVEILDMTVQINVLFLTWSIYQIIIQQGMSFVHLYVNYQATFMKFTIFHNIPSSPDIFSKIIWRISKLDHLSSKF